MSEALAKVFEKDGYKLRTIVRDGEPWFVGNDVAEALGYKTSKDAVAKHCKSAELLKGGESTPLSDSPYGVNVIPEKDVYRLVMRSQLEGAEKFQDWVMDEVLPSLRKTGLAIDGVPADILADPRMENLKQMIRTEALAIANERRIGSLETGVAKLTGRVEFSDTHVPAVNWLNDNGYPSDHGSAQRFGSALSKLAKAYDVDVPKRRPPGYTYAIGYYPVTFLEEHAVEVANAVFGDV